MSRLTELLQRAAQKDPDLAAELEREVRALSGRRAYGLNFERHRPEAVELPQRTVRKGDKVRTLPDRGSTAKGDQRLWRVTRISKEGDRRIGQLELLDGSDPETDSVPTEDLVVVAEFRDPIYPGLVSTGKVERGGDRPFHTIVSGENFHALKALTFTHKGKVDAIYIDPPYNTGAKDWKYNNDYVEDDDLYRHSKWLAFIERRLTLAKELLRPDSSVLIVAIDENEIHRLGLLLEQMFPDSKPQMVTSVINPRGKFTAGRFLRTAEYLFCLTFGGAVVGGEDDPDYSEGETVPWRTLRRSDIESRRGTAKGGTNQFFPIYVNAESGRIVDIGEPLTHHVPAGSVPNEDGCVAVLPMRDDGTEMNWGLTRPSLRLLLDAGFVRVGRATPQKPQKYEISYLTSGRVEDIRSGRATIVGSEKCGAVIAKYVEAKQKMPSNVWTAPSHNAEVGGTNLLKDLLGDKRFDYPKSLYAVEDMLRHFVSNRPEAIVVDFFAGSGTTCHAVMRLNREDGGSRQTLLVTNNEVAASTQAGLRAAGLRPGDPEWESGGICNHVTRARLLAAVEGLTPGGNPVGGVYRGTEGYPLAEGFRENVEFFTLTYESPVGVGHNRAFEQIAPLLWLRAGAVGRRIDSMPPSGWDVADTYGVIADLDEAQAFCDAMRGPPCARMAYVVTDDDRRFQSVVRRLPEGVEPVRLYESYLSNFKFMAGE